MHTMVTGAGYKVISTESKYRKQHDTYIVRYRWNKAVCAGLCYRKYKQGNELHIKPKK